MVIALGTAFGLSCLSGATQPYKESKDSELKSAKRGLKRLTRAVRRLEGGLRSQETTARPQAQRWVTEQDLQIALERLRSAVRSDTDIRLEANERTMESLQAMIVETDAMLERVLENLESDKT